MLTSLQTMAAHDFFASLAPSWLDSAATTGLTGRYLFHIEADKSSSGGTWLVDADSRKVTAHDKEAAPAKPHVVVRAYALDFMALLDGSMSPAEGLLSQRLHLSGDIQQLDNLMQALAQGREAMHTTRRTA